MGDVFNRFFCASVNTLTPHVDTGRMSLQNLPQTGDVETDLLTTPDAAVAPGATAPAPAVCVPTATAGDNLFLGPTWPETKLGRFMVKGFGRLLVGAVRGSEFLRNVGVELGTPANARNEDEALSRWMDRRGWPALPLQIRIHQAGDWSEDLIAARGVFLPQWGEVSSPHVNQASNFDAIVSRTTDGGVQVTTIERAGREATWFDWSQERPLSYPGVFPVRVDCSQVTLTANALGSTDPLIVRLLIEAAALCARHPERLTLDDRISGRNVGWASNSQHGTVDNNADTDPLTLVVRALTEALNTADQTTRRSPAARVAARLLSAWAITARAVEPAIVRSAVECAWDVNNDEVETALRVGAVRLAQLDDPAGLAALEYAASLLRSKVQVFPAEQAEFVVSELKTQSDTPEGVARISAGIVLVGAALPAEHLRHFKQDFLDDARISGALIGQDQDTHLILQVFRMLERRAGIAYVPVPSTIDPTHAADARPAPTPGGYTFPRSAGKRPTRTTKTKKPATKRAKNAIPFKSAKKTVKDKATTRTGKRRAA